MSTTPATPDGYWKDYEGRLIPLELVKPIDRLRHELVLKLVAQAQAMNTALAELKTNLFSEVGAFVELSAAEYGMKMGGEKGNVTLVSFDGQFKVVRSVQESISFDERLQVAKAMIDECITRWAQGSRAEIQALITNAFRVNKQGQINTANVLGLKRLDIKDEQWQQAMQAITDSVRANSSRSYMRFYKRVGNTDAFEAIPLDLASVGEG